MMENGEYHPMDLLQQKIQNELFERNRNAHAYILNSDSRFDQFFKHYHTIMSYQHSYDELAQKAIDYRAMEDRMGLAAMKSQEIAQIQDTLTELKDQAVSFNQQFERIKETVVASFQAQLEEYISAVDTQSAFGLDKNMGKVMAKLHSKIDGLISTIDLTTDKSSKFKEAMIK